MSLEHTILNIIQKRKRDMQDLLEKRRGMEISPEQYYHLQSCYQQSVNDMYMALTCHDNPQSEYSVLYNNKKEII